MTFKFGDKVHNIIANGIFLTKLNDGFVRVHFENSYDPVVIKITKLKKGWIK